VPSKEESLPLTTSISNTLNKSSDYFSMPFILIELKNAISSRKSAAPGLDGISPLMLKHTPPIGLEILLKILNDVWNSDAIPLSWREFRVIPIPKHGSSNGAYRSIAISFIFCKLIEHVLKNCLDYYLESNLLIPNNLYDFHRGMGTMECLAALIGPIY